MKHERPLKQSAILGLVRVEDNKELPRAPRVLGPRVRRHEGPLGEAVHALVVLGAPAQDHRSSKENKGFIYKFSREYNGYACCDAK